MSLPKYRLHEALGGGEVEGVVDLSNERTVGINVPGIASIVYVSREILTKVREYPPMPPLYSFVLADVEGRRGAYERVPQGWVSWRHPNIFYTWHGLCKESDPVLLAAMDPVTLPWKPAAHLPVQTVAPMEVSNGVQDVILRCGHRDMRFSPSVAKEMAQALWTAAEKIERGGI